MSNHDFIKRDFPAPFPRGRGGASGFRKKQPLETEKKEPIGNKKNMNILLVEDNMDHAGLTMEVLSMEGFYHVEHACSGSEALYKLAAGDFSVILLDYCMWGMDGLQLMRKIKQQRYDIPIIMLSGLGSEAVAVEAMKNGAFDYLTKRENYLEALPALIDKALEQHELKRIREEWDRWLFERHLKLGALNSIYETLGFSLDPAQLLKDAVGKTVRALEADCARIHLKEELAEQIIGDSRQTVETPVGSIEKDYALDKEERVNATLRQVVRMGESLVLDDTTSGTRDQRPEAKEDLLRSMAYVPLKCKETVLGVVVLGSYRRRHFTREDSRLLNAVGSHIGAALENAIRYEALRRQAERARESEDKYRTLVEKADDAVLVVQNHLICYANRKASELTGYSTDRLCQMGLLDLATPEHKDRVLSYCAAKMKREKTPHCEIVLAQQDGKPVLLELSGSLVEYNGQPALEIIAREVNEEERFLQWLFMQRSWI